MDRHTGTKETGKALFASRPSFFLRRDRVCREFNGVSHADGDYRSHSEFSRVARYIEVEISRYLFLFNDSSKHVIAHILHQYYRASNITAVNC